MKERQENLVRFGRFPRYRPCENGIHVCGIDDQNSQFFTFLNLTLAKRRVAALFDQARTELAIEGEGDFVVDMMIGGKPVEAFRIRRQLLPRLAEITEAT